MECNNIVVFRGGGDIATGSIQKVKRAGFKVVVLEVAKPSSIRRKVCMSEAVYDGKVTVEDIEGVLVKQSEEIFKVLNDDKIAVIIDTKGEIIEKIKPIAVIDAILAKKNLGTNREMAPITIGLGPGFEAGKDVDIAIETMRGHNLGRLIFKGKTMENTGVPGIIKGVGKERVIYSENEGHIKNIANIGDYVEKGEVIAKISNKDVVASISGVLRGIIRENYYVEKGLKIADIDPRREEKNNCFTISDKARNVGGATLEALMIMLKRNNMKENK